MKNLSRFILLAFLLIGKNTFADNQTERCLTEEAIKKLTEKKLEFEDCQPYKDFIYVYTGKGKKRKIGMVDADGNIILPLQKIDTISWISKKYKTMIVSKKGKYGMIDFTGKVIVPFKYKNIDISGIPLSEDYLKNENTFFIWKDKNTYGLMRENGEMIIPVEYDIRGNNNRLELMLANTVSNYNVIVLSKKTKKGWKRTWMEIETGKMLVPMEYEKIGLLGNYFPNVKIYQVGNKNLSGLIDANGKMILPVEYENIWGYVMNDIFVMELVKNGKQIRMYMDKTGKFISEDEANKLSNP